MDNTTALETLKTCARCRASLPRTSEFFGFSKSAKDGFYQYCRSCNRIKNRARYDKIRVGQLGTHGHAKIGAMTHEYRCWSSMRTRCLNPNVKAYARYGGRGVRLCDAWLKFENFYADMGDAPSPQHSIDRINGNGNYEPANCRWATKKEQARNRRTNRHITYNSETLSLVEWAERLGLTPEGLAWRLKTWRLEEALTRLPAVQ